MLAGTVTSMIPGGAPVVDEAFKKGILPPRTANHQLGMAIGELLGGAVQLFGSWCMFGGGAVVTTTGIGAIIGAPALAASVGLAGVGILNITSGVQNLIGALNSLSSGGGGSGPPNQTAAPSQDGLDFSGPKAMEHLRKHAQHARETATRQGLPRPNGLDDVKGFLSRVVKSGERRVGTWGDLGQVQFHRLGDAVVISRMNGQYVTNLDISKGGSIVERWAAATRTTP